MAGKFEKMAALIIEDNNRLFNRQLRRSLRAAVRAAVGATKHDSSNAAYHWLIAEQRHSRPGQRFQGTVRDLRGKKGGRNWGGGETSSPEPGRDGVGLFRDGGKNHKVVLRNVMTREEAAVIGKYARGSTPARKYTLYHGLIAGRGEPYSAKAMQIYAERANIEAAGNAGVEAFIAAMNRYTQEGKTRK